MTLPVPLSQIEIHTGREAWLDARRGRIGASEVAAILGISPFAGPWDIWAKRQGFEAPQGAGREGSFARGHRYERRALEDYSEDAGVPVYQPPAIYSPGHADAQIVVVHPSLLWATCTPDGFERRTYANADVPVATSRDLDRLPLDQALHPYHPLAGHAAPRDGVHRPRQDRLVEIWGGVEAKTTSSPRGWGPSQVVEHWRDELAAVVPPHYAVQCYWSLAVTGLPSWTLVVLLPWYQVRWYTLRADPAIQAQLLRSVGEWRERHLVRGEPPAVSGADACSRWLAATYAGGSPVREATMEEDQQALRLLQVRAELRALTEERAALTNALRAACADAETLTLSTGARWTPRRPKPQAEVRTWDDDMDPLDFEVLT